MTKSQHSLYIGFFTIVTLAVLALLIYDGYTYYITPIDERFFLPEHANLKSSGFLGHGYGIIGSILMIVGVSIYMMRKRMKIFMRFGILKHWLELHIFLCTVGPILVLFHTAFKFGGIVAVSFWSMVAVFISGIIGRFIYIRIPRTIEGQEMNIQQINTINDNLTLKLLSDFSLSDTVVNKIKKLTDIEFKGRASFSNLLISIIPDYFEKRNKIKEIKKILKNSNVEKSSFKEIVKITSEKLSISNKIHYLRLMQSILKYWHVVHLPFALIMLVIMFIHIIVTISFGYRWVF